MQQPWVLARGLGRATALLLFLLLLSVSARAGCIRFEEHAGWVGAASNPDGVYGIAVRAPYAYAASGLRGLVVYDVSDKAHPQPFGAIRLFGTATDVLLLSPTRAVVALTSELCLIDITVPAVPTLLDRIPLGRSLQQLARADSTIYAAGGPDGLLSARWTKHDRLVAGPPLSTGGNAVGVAIGGRIAYVAAENFGLVVVNLSADGGPRVVLQRPSEGDVNGIACSRDVAVLSDSETGLLLFDVSDPLNPTLRASHEAETGAPMRPLLVERQLFAPEGQDHLRVFDTGNGDQLLPRASLRGAGRARCVTLSDGYVYYGDGSGLWIASADARIEVAATSSMRPRSAPSAMASSGHLIALAEPALGVELLEVGDDGSLTRQTWWDELDRPTDVALRPPYAFAATQSEGIVSLDFRDYLEPKVLSRGQGRFDHVSLWGDRLVALTDGNLAIFDISDPSAPRKIVTHPSATPATDVIAGPDGKVLVVAPNRIDLVDWSSASGPLVLATFAASGNQGTAAFFGASDILYAQRAETSGPTTLHLVDLSTPGVASIAWSLELPSKVERITSAPPYVYLTSAESGVTLLDLSDPEHPLRAGNLMERASLAAAIGENFVLATAESISVLPAECGAEPPITIENLRAIADVGRVRLEWKAEPGLFDHFEIERAPVLAIGEPAFEALGSVAADEGPLQYDDFQVQQEVGYQYRVTGVTPREARFPIGPVSAVSPGARTVLFFAPYPTPARGKVTLRYFLPRRGPLSLSIFDPTGRAVRRWSFADAPPGGGVVQWSGDDAQGRVVPGGVYFARIESGRFVETRRVVWLR